MTKRISAGELSRKAMADNTKYNALEVGHALADEIMPQLRICIENHKKIIDENEFCIVMIIAKDPLIHNLQRRKFYAWPYLPKPRPNQSVFLYNKGKDAITHRLWILPSDVVMAELHSLSTVDRRYRSMKAWSDAFYKGWKFKKYKKTGLTEKNFAGDIVDIYLDDNGKKTHEPGIFYNSDPLYFWKFIRRESNITMPSEHEYFLEHREELIESGCKIPNPNDTEAFDFSKVAIEKVIDSTAAVLSE